ncbi:MAG: hypothetical protein V8Q84_00005 [Bilophila sp.]
MACAAIIMASCWKARRSTDGGDAYSILACDFLLQAACRDGRLALALDDKRLMPFRVLEGLPFMDGLRALMHGLHLEKPEGAECHSLPGRSTAISATVVLPASKT